MNLIENKLIM